MRKRPIFFVKVFVGLCALALLGVYFFYQSRIFLLGPQLSVEYPLSGQTLKNSLLLIKGQALNASSVLINGQQVLCDSMGNFSRKLLLAQGYNIIEITVRDKFGREVNKKLPVVLKY